MNELLRPVKLLTTALSIGVLVFAGIAVVLTHVLEIAPFERSTNPFMFYAGLLISVIAIATGFSLFRKRSLACSVTDEKEKIEQYRAAIVLLYAFLEGPALFNIIGYLLGGNDGNLILVILSLAFMLLQQPSEEKFNRFGQ